MQLSHIQANYNSFETNTTPTKPAHRSKHAHIPTISDLKQKRKKKNERAFSNITIRWQKLNLYYIST